MIERLEVKVEGWRNRWRRYRHRRRAIRDKKRRVREHDRRLRETGIATDHVLTVKSAKHDTNN